MSKITNGGLTRYDTRWWASKGLKCISSAVCGKQVESSAQADTGAQAETTHISWREWRQHAVYDVYD